MPELSALVLYRTPRGWRYAIYAGGVMDGVLHGVPLTESPEEAQNALLEFVQGGTGRPVHAEWRQSKADWWEATARFAD